MTTTSDDARPAGPLYDILSPEDRRAFAAEADSVLRYYPASPEHHRIRTLLNALTAAEERLAVQGTGAGDQSGARTSPPTPLVAEWPKAGTLLADWRTDFENRLWSGDAGTEEQARRALGLLNTLERIEKLVRTSMRHLNGRTVVYGTDLIAELDATAPQAGDDTPDPTPVQVPSDENTYRADFTPEAWVNDQAIEVDPEGETTWDATAYVHANPGLADYLKAAAARDSDVERFGVLDRDDRLLGDPNAPAWIRNWHGPSTVHVRIVPAITEENER